MRKIICCVIAAFIISLSSCAVISEDTGSDTDTLQDPETGSDTVYQTEAVSESTDYPYVVTEESAFMILKTDEICPDYFTGCSVADTSEIYTVYKDITLMSGSTDYLKVYYTKIIQTGEFTYELDSAYIKAYTEFPITVKGEGKLTLNAASVMNDSFTATLSWPYPTVYTVYYDISDLDYENRYIEITYSKIIQTGEWTVEIIPDNVTEGNPKDSSGENIVRKPIIYLYPETPLDVTVRLDYDGKLLYTYPEYNGAWQVTAYPDGTLKISDGSEYYCLFWEGMSDNKYDFSNGFCIKGADTAAFLREKLLYMGLSERETNEFIIYWLPLMKDNIYNVISFQTDIYLDSAKLIITPEPDSLLRVFMAYYPSDKFINIEARELPSFERIGFTAVEWGGSEVYAE